MNRKNKPKIRRSWGIINPATKIINPKKKYDRKNNKKIIEKEMGYDI